MAFYTCNIELVKEMLATMPEQKKKVLDSACTRNFYLTSYYGLEFLTFTVYIEGFLIEMEGTRAKFSVWAKDNDGELVFTRKPAESRLRKLYSQQGRTEKIIDDIREYV